jgi:PAS domain S-box-containing protein
MSSGIMSEVAALAEAQARIAALEAALDRETARRGEDRLRLKQALGSAGMVGIWDGDSAAGIVYADENFARIYGVDPSMARDGTPSRYYIGFTHVDDRARVIEKFEAVRSGESDEFEDEHRILPSDGTLRWVHSKGRMTRDAAGGPLRFSGVAVDITARKAEEARQGFLRGLQERLRTLQAPEAILREAAEALGRFLGANRIGYGRVRADRETIEVSCEYRFEAPAIEGVFSLDAFGARNLALLRAGRTVAHDDVLADPGRDRDVWDELGTRAHVSVPMLRDGAYRGTLFVSYLRPHEWSSAEIGLIEAVAAGLWEAAERSRAEATLRESEALARQALVESEKLFRGFAQEMPHHIWSSTPDGSIDWFNDRVEEYTGKSAAALMGKAGWQAVIHPDDLAAVAANRAEMVAGRPVDMEYRLRRADGVYRWFMRRAVAIRGEDGAVRRWLGTATDIEEQKRDAAALAELNASLEAQIGERTAELMAAEAALRQSQKMEAVGQLTGGIAHDFNNMLQGIAGAIELMERRIGQGRAAEAGRYVAAARDGVKRAANLTQQLLAFSRRQVLAPKRVELPELVWGIAGLIRQTAGPGIAFEPRFAAEGWAVRCDPNQLENAILNLAINARDAMLPAGGRLSVETAHARLGAAEVAGWEGAAPGDYVRLTVADTGKGMSAEVLDHAFEPFFTTKPAGRGTGLGLSQVYGFVRQSNGVLVLESEVGVGTSVHVYLPRDLE